MARPPQVAQALLTILGLVLPRVSNAVLRAKWGSATNLVAGVAREHEQQARSG
jgi:hypothetical protein